MNVGAARLLPLAAVVLMSLPLVAGDLKWVMEETNLEKRSERAWKNADKALDEAREAFKKGDYTAEDALVAEIRQSVDLCKQSLDDSGKDARKNSKYFKRAEIGLRNLQRRLDTFRTDHGIDYREPITQLMQHISKIHAVILEDIMTKD